VDLAARLASGERRQGVQWFSRLGNYLSLFTDPHFYNALYNTLTIFLEAAVPQVLLALAIAALLNRPLRGGRLWRTGVLLPNVVSVVAVALVFGQLFGRDYGIVNWLLGRLGIGPVACSRRSGPRIWPSR